MSDFRYRTWEILDLSNCIPREDTTYYKKEIQNLRCVRLITILAMAMSGSLPPKVDVDRLQLDENLLTTDILNFALEEIVESRN